MLYRKKRSFFLQPVRHLLLIRFLFGSLETFITSKEILKPFGDGPWPCLNPISSHYKELLVNECEITYYKGLKNPIGIFRCECGFIYSKAINNLNTDKPGKILQYGDLWDKAFISLINKNYNLAQIARQMRCDSQTVKRQANRLCLELPFKELQPKFKDLSSRILKIELYRKTIVEFITRNPNATREVIKKSLIKEYTYLYRNDNEWFNNVLPKPYPNGRKFYVNQFETIDWKKRDAEINNMLKMAIREILNEVPPIRISRNLMAIRIGSHYLNKNRYLERMPLTKKTLLSAIESKEVFQKRKSDKNNNNV